MENFIYIKLALFGGQIFAVLIISMVFRLQRNILFEILGLVGNVSSIPSTKAPCNILVYHRLKNCFVYMLCTKECR